MAKLNKKWPLAGVLSGLVILVSGAMPSEAHLARRVAPIERSALREQLGLTDDQVNSIKEIRARHWQAMRETVRALRDARRALRDMVLADADEATFAAKATEVKDLSGQVMEARARTLQEVARVLTPEQREKLRQLRPMRMHRPTPLAG
ncbi:MAG TPA: Spy/CpxP family protein refolding chaperone [Methylomirabilota bacterium]|jgi:Spy/CpxP family protein refolding chaperone